MNAVMSSAALDLYLSDIKEITRNYDFSRLKKMIFLNPDSFFKFIDYGNGTGGTGKSFSEIIDIIEPFIPMIINDENLSAYLLTALEQDEEALNRVQEQLTQSSKVRFVKNLFNARSDEDMDEIFEICRTIRDYKENNL